MTYINPREKVFAHLDRLAAWQRGEKPAPVTIEWDLSNRCPWGCKDCHFAYTHTKGPWTRQDRMLPMAHDPGGDLADTALVLRVLAEVRDAGVQGIVWTGGGEPTVHPDFRYIVRHAHYLGLQQGVYTLGATLNEGDGWLADVLTWVVVSLDAADERTYAKDKGTTTLGFGKACKAIQSLAKQGTRQSGTPSAAVGVSFLLHEDNWMQAITRMLPLSRDLGATYTTFRPTIRTSPDNPALPVGDRSWVTDAYPFLVALAKEPDVEVDPARFLAWRDWQSHGYGTCLGVRLNTTITPDGRMWLCPNRREYGQSSCMGDLRQESFAAIWSLHTGSFEVDRDCRAMCRLHPVNQSLAAIHAPRSHEAFI